MRFERRRRVASRRRALARRCGAGGADLEARVLVSLERDVRVRQSAAHAWACDETDSVPRAPRGAGVFPVETSAVVEVRSTARVRAHGPEEPHVHVRHGCEAAAPVQDVQRERRLRSKAVAAGLADPAPRFDARPVGERRLEGLHQSFRVVVVPPAKGNQTSQQVWVAFTDP